MANNKLSESGRNITWDLNHQIIRDSYVNLIRELERKPTYEEVAKDSKLSINTIKKHIKELKFDPLKHPLRVLTDDILISIAKSAKEGSYASQKLWMQVCEGWSEKQEITHGLSPSLADLVKKYREESKLKSE